GKSANLYHLPYVMIRETLDVKTIFDLHVNEKGAAPFKEKGVNFTTDLNKLLTDQENELVTNCTAAHTHCDLAKQTI
ncbi:oxidoreductase, partial [Enterococcus faecalis]